MALYDKIGGGYEITRKADERILNTLLSLIEVPLGGTILDVGAGTGKYAHPLAERGYKVIAVEPSGLMQSQAPKSANIQWVTSSAENIGIADSSAQAAIIMLAIHHFEDTEKAIREILRVVNNGPVIIFTFEPVELRNFWLADYFPTLGRENNSSYATIPDVASYIAHLTGRKTRTVKYPLPPDLEDKFAAACWQKPEEYLNLSVRQGISSFALIPNEEVEYGLKSLRNDIDSGHWKKKYGHLLLEKEYDIGYKFIVA